MLFVLNRNEKVISVLKNDGGHMNFTPYFDDLHERDLETGAETFSFSVPSVNQMSEIIVVGNYVAFMQGSKYKLFQIVSVEEAHQESCTISAYCESAGLSLINEIFRARTLLSVTVENFFKEVLADTPWEVGIVDEEINKTSFTFQLENQTVYKLIQDNLSELGAEIDFRVEIKGGRVVNRFIDIYKQRGSFKGKRFNFGTDITTLTRKVDSSELCTALIGFGNNSITFKNVTIDGIDKPIGQDFLEDNESFEKYNNNGRHIFGMFTYETDSPYDLLLQTKKELEKRSKPKVEYEIDVALLNEEVELGDTVNIVDFYFSPPLQLQARVKQLSTSKTDFSQNKCVLGNFVELGSKISNQTRSILTETKKSIETTISSKFPLTETSIGDSSISTAKLKEESVTNEKIKSVDAIKLTGDITMESLVANVVKAINNSNELINSDKIQSDPTITLSSEVDITTLLERIGQLEKKIEQLEK